MIWLYLFLIHAQFKCFSGSTARAGAKNSKDQAPPSKATGPAATNHNGKDKVNKLDNPTGKGKDTAASSEKGKEKKVVEQPTRKETLKRTSAPTANKEDQKLGGKGATSRASAKISPQTNATATKGTEKTQSSAEPETTRQTRGKGTQAAEADKGMDLI